MPIALLLRLPGSKKSPAYQNSNTELYEIVNLYIFIDKSLISIQTIDIVLINIVWGKTFYVKTEDEKAYTELSNLQISWHEIFISYCRSNERIYGFVRTLYSVVSYGIFPIQYGLTRYSRIGLQLVSFIKKSMIHQ